MLNLSRWHGRKTYALIAVGLAAVWAQHYGLLAVNWEGQPIDLGGSEPIVTTFKLLLAGTIRHAIGRKSS